MIFRRPRLGYGDLIQVARGACQQRDRDKHTDYYFYNVLQDALAKVYYRRPPGVIDTEQGRLRYLVFMKWEEREAERGVFLLIQHVGDTDVVGNDGRNATDDPSCLGHRFAGVEDTSREGGKCGREEEEQCDEADALAQAYDANINAICQIK